MKKQFSTSWIRSTQPRKQRKYGYNAPLHRKQKKFHAHLSAELRKKYGLRSVSVRTGDTIRIARGQFKKKDGKVDRIILKRERMFVKGIELIKKDGVKIPYPLHPSNVLILELDLGDKKRKKKIEAHLKKGSAPAEAVPAAPVMATPKNPLSRPDEKLKTVHPQHH